MTINLENRRKIDFGLIKNATGKHPRTFTELLHITKLSRKTLNLRLQELCKEGVLIKYDGGYRLNGSLHNEDKGKDFVKGFLNGFHNKKLRTGLILIAFMISFSTSGYVLAKFLTPPQQQFIETLEPAILGNFTMSLYIHNVKDLYAWQAVIIFNSSELKVLEVLPGDFLKIEYPYFVNVTDVIDNGLFLGGTMCGNVHGIDGSGELATVTFGYFVDNYKEPTIVPKQGFLETGIADSAGSPINLNESTMLTLTPLQK
jgi:DNA-binding Lrp family transcriptional regulator